MNTAARLHERGMRVSYLLQVPELGISAPDCLGRPLTLSRQADRCRVPYDTYQDRMQAYRARINGLGVKVPYLHIIDVESALCSAGGCYGLIDGQLMYADDNHLSVVGSRRVAPLIMKVALPVGGQ